MNGVQNGSNSKGMITRPSISCLPCRSRKVKCDRQNPCSHCQRRNEECVWPSSTSSSRWNGKQKTRNEQEVQHTSTSGDRIVGIESRLADLEQYVNRIQAKQRGGLSTNASSSEPNLTNQTLEGTSNEITQLRPDDIVDLDEFDHQIISTQRKRIRRYSPVRSTFQESPSSINHFHSPIQNVNGNDHEDEGQQHKLNKIFYRLFRKLPPTQECDELLNEYWLRVEWIHHIIYRPKFEKWFEKIRNHFNQPFDIIKNNQIIIEFQDIHSLGLLFCILCLSLHFSQNCSKEDHWRAKQFYDLSNKALEQGEYLDNHSLPTIQTLIMQGIWLNDHGKSDRHHVNLAMAIRIANLMGMPRQDIGKLITDPDKKGIPELISNSASLHYDSIQELSRRVYWSLICQDCYTSSSCNFTYMIQPTQVYISQPANLADDDIEANRMNTIPTSLHKSQTEMSYHIAKIPFAILTRQTIDLFGKSTLDIHFDKVKELERSIFEEYDKLPSYLKIEKEEIQMVNKIQLLWQKIFLKVGIHYRIMRIYRPFVIRGYYENVYKHATNSALSAAISLLDLIHQSLNVNFPGIRWWVVRIQIFTAGVLCCVALHQQQKSKERKDYQFQKEELEFNAWLALELLDNGVENSPAAQKAMTVLEALIEQAIGEKEEIEDEILMNGEENASNERRHNPTQIGQEEDQYNSTLQSPSLSIEEAHPLIPTIDWTALLGGTIGDPRETLNDSRALAEVINAFGPNSWQL